MADPTNAPDEARANGYAMIYVLGQIAAIEPGKDEAGNVDETKSKITLEPPHGLPDGPNRRWGFCEVSSQRRPGGCRTEWGFSAQHFEQKTCQGIHVGTPVQISLSADLLRTHVVGCT